VRPAASTAPRRSAKSGPRCVPVAAAAAAPPLTPPAQAAKLEKKNRGKPTEAPKEFAGFVEGKLPTGKPRYVEKALAAAAAASTTAAAGLRYCYAHHDCA